MLAVCMALTIWQSPATTADEAMSWAIGLYGKCSRLPNSGYPIDEQRVYDAFAEVERKHGATDATKLWRARTLFRWERYTAAAKLYSEIGASRNEAHEAKRRASIQRSMGANLGLQPLALENGKIWVGVKGDLESGDDLEIVSAEVGRGTVSIRDRLDLKPLIRGGEAVEVRLYPTTQTIGKGKLVFAHISLLGGSTSPSILLLLEVQGSKLRLVKSLDSAFRFEVSAIRGGFKVVVPTGWKIAWPDTYELRDGQLRLANWRYPEDYRTELKRALEDVKEYPRAGLPLIRAGSCYMILGRRDLAQVRFHEAERKLRRNVSDRSGSDLTWLPDAFYGSMDSLLAETRLRVDLLRRGRVTDPILYRPFGGEHLGESPAPFAS